MARLKQEHGGDMINWVADGGGPRGEYSRVIALGQERQEGGFWEGP